MGMASDFRIGQGVCWNAGRNIVSYGVVLNVSDNALSLAEVGGLDGFVKCYDDAGADYRSDRHNVRLSDCPPPFSGLCRQYSDGCYAIADLDDLTVFDQADVSAFGVSVIDNGHRISGKDMSVIRDHPWPEQYERERSFQEDRPRGFLPGRIYGSPQSQRRGYEFDFGVQQDDDELSL